MCLERESITYEEYHKIHEDDIYDGNNEVSFRIPKHIDVMKVSVLVVGIFLLSLNFIC